MDKQIKKVELKLESNPEVAYEYQYAKSDFYCIFCGSQDVWEEQNLEKRTILGGGNLVCCTCDTLFNEPDSWEANPSIAEQIKANTIVFINGEPRAVHYRVITFEYLLEVLGYPEGSLPSVLYTRGKNGTKGTLVPGQAIQIEPYMRFSAYFTGNA